MKKVVISGSLRQKKEIDYWKSYFENKGYEVINYPHYDESVSFDEAYKKFYTDIENCDIFFLMNVEQRNIEGYIGASTFSELTYAIMNNVVHNKNIKVLMLSMPSMALFCYDEVIRMLDLGWLNFFHSEEL